MIRKRVKIKIKYQIQNDGNDFSDLEKIKESEEEKEDYNIQNNNNENKEIEIDNKYQQNLIDIINDKNIDNLDNFLFNLQHLLFEISYKNYKGEREKLLLEKD